MQCSSLIPKQQPSWPYSDITAVIINRTHWATVFTYWVALSMTRLTDLLLVTACNKIQTCWVISHLICSSIPSRTIAEYFFTCSFLVFAYVNWHQTKERLTQQKRSDPSCLHAVHTDRASTRGRCCVVAAVLFASLNAIGLAGGYAPKESIFFPPQSHTPEVKHDQINPLRCCVGLLCTSHRGNQQMKSLKAAYFHSQELSGIQPLCKAMFLAQWASW